MKLISFDPKEDSILGKLYTDKSCEWIEDLAEEDVVPHVIQLWLLANTKLRVQARWLDKYTYTLPPKMYLSLAWSIIPKTNRMPFMNYVKKNVDEEEYSFILDTLRKQYELSDNDFKILKGRIINDINSHKEDWFKYYGVNKRLWKLHKLDFNKIRGEVKVEKSGLEAFGI